LHTVAVAEVIQKETEITETLEAWDQVMVIKTEAVQAVAVDLTTDNNSAVAVVVAEHQTQELMQDAQQFKMELDHLVV
jgi:transposase